MELNEAMNQGLGCSRQIDLPMGHYFQVENLAINTPHQVCLSKEAGRFM
jgi:hypothetical protein